MKVNETAPFQGTREQETALREFIDAQKAQPGCLIPIMQKAQEIYGYLPRQVQQQIADGVGVPLSRIFGIATFYSMFNLYPKGKHRVSVCLGTACYVKGSGALHTRLEEILGIGDGMCTPDGLFSLDSCRCVGACGLAPVILVDDDVYARVNAGELSKILDKYR